MTEAKVSGLLSRLYASFGKNVPPATKERVYNIALDIPDEYAGKILEHIESFDTFPSNISKAILTAAMASGWTRLAKGLGCSGCDNGGYIYAFKEDVGAKMYGIPGYIDVRMFRCERCFPGLPGSTSKGRLTTEGHTVGYSKQEVDKLYRDIDKQNAILCRKKRGFIPLGSGNNSAQDILNRLKTMRSEEAKNQGAIT